MANQQQSRVSPAEVEEHLRGVDYPASKQDLIQYAQDHNAPQEVIQVLDRIPDRVYASAVDLAKGIGTMG